MRLYPNLTVGKHELNEIGVALKSFFDPFHSHGVNLLGTGGFYVNQQIRS